MALPAEDVTVLRKWVGDEPDNPTLEALYGVYENYDDVVLHVLTHRLANLSLEPNSVTVPGLSISRSNDAQALKAHISDFKNSGGTGLEESFGGGFRVQSIKVNYPR